MATKTKAQRLKELREQQKAQREEMKKIREEMSKGKEERVKARKEHSEARGIVKKAKADLRNLTAKISPTFKENDVEAINNLADQLMEAATTLTSGVRKFADATESLEDL